MAFSDFARLPASGKRLLVTIGLMLRAQPATTTTLYFSDGGYNSSLGSGSIPADRHYSDRVREGMQWSVSALGPSGAVFGADTSLGDLVLSNDDGAYDWLHDWTVADQTILFHVGPAEGPDSDYQLVATGRGVALTVVGNEIQIRVADRKQRLRKRVRPIYSGFGPALRFTNAGANWVRDKGQALRSASAYAGAAGKTLECRFYIDPATSTGSTYVNLFGAGLKYRSRIRVTTPTIECTLTRPTGGVWSQRVVTSNTLSDYSWWALGIWYHLAIVPELDAIYLGHDSMDLVNVCNAAITTDGLTALTYPDRFTIGRMSTEYGTLYNTSGDITMAEVRVWSEARSPAEVESLRNGAIPDSLKSGLALYVPLNEGTSDPRDYAPGSRVVLQLGNDAGSNPTWLVSHEGQTALEGRAKPAAWGYVYNAEAILVDPALLIYQLTDGYADVITAVYDSAATVTLGASRTSLLSLTTTAPTAGQWDYTQTTRGTFIRLGSNPSGTVTWDGRGNRNAAGVFRADWRSLMTTIYTERLGLPSGDLGTSMTAPTNRWLSEGPPLGYWWGPERTDLTYDQVFDELARASFGFWYLDGPGKVQIDTFHAPVARGESGTFDAKLILETDAFSYRWQEHTPPLWRIHTGWKRNWKQLPANEIAGIVATTDRSRYQFVLGAGQDRWDADADLLTVWPNATEGAADNYLIATERAAREVAMWKRKGFGRNGRVLEVTVPLRFWALELGDELLVSSVRQTNVQVTYLDVGRWGMINGIEMKLMSKRLAVGSGGFECTLLLWAPDRAVRVTRSGLALLTTAGDLLVAD